MSVLKYLNDTQTARLWAKIKAGFVSKSGGTMTGALTLSGAPTSELHAATKGYVDEAIGSVTGLSFEIVQSLPQTGDAGTIYLVPNSGSSPNIYDEYIYVANAWEKIGTTEIDLSGYVQTSRKVNNKALSSDISLTASDVGALPSTTSIPSKTSDLTNDSGFITGYTETDPTVPSWAKASSKPSYTAEEVGAQAEITASGLLKGDGSGGVSAATAGTDYAAASHSHGNITSGGDITATAPTIASGDQLVINDNSASKITNGPTFDGSTTTKALTPKGTWETFLTLATLPIYDGTVV